MDGWMDGEMRTADTVALAFPGKGRSGPGEYEFGMERG